MVTHSSILAWRILWTEDQVATTHRVAKSQIRLSTTIQIYYYLVLLDCFPLFLHFLTSLIKLILWLKFFHRQKAGGGHGGARTIDRILLCFRMVQILLLALIYKMSKQIYVCSRHHQLPPILPESLKKFGKHSKS